MPATPANLMTRESGARILHWMRAEFDGVRSQLHALASSLAHQQALVSDLAAGRADDLNSAVAELEGSATQLRTEASRMRRDATGLQEDGAELRNEAAKLRDLERRMSELPQVVADAVQPELRAALVEVEAVTAGLREEAARLRTMRDGLAEQLPRIVEAAVLQAMAAYAPPAPAAAAVAPSAVATSETTAGTATHAGLTGAAPSPAPGALADEPVEEVAVSSFGPPPAAPVTANVAADGGVGEDPLACVLPGLVIGPSLALAVSDGLRRAGLRRRRRRRPAKPVPGLNRRDPFATDVTRRLDRYARARSDLATIRPAAVGSGQATRATPTMVAGFRDGEEVAVDLAEVSAVALVGPGVADVARSLITSFMAHNGPGGAQAVVVGDLLAPVGPLEGLSRPVDLATALAQLAAAGDITPRATVLLATGGGSAEELAVLEGLLDREEGPRVVALFIDDGADGALVPKRSITIRVDPTHRVTDVTVVPVGPSSAAGEALAVRMQGARLYTLGGEAAVELLCVLAGGRTDDEVVSATDASPTEAFEVHLPEVPSVSVQLLGPYRIEVGGAEIRAGLRAKARELLAFYLLHPAGTTLDAAVEALWPEADAGRGSEWFWTALGNLRSRLRDATGEKKLKVIERDGDRYRVEPLFDVDLWRLEQAMSVGAVELDDFGRAAAYDRVAASYTGELLTGADWAWVETSREDLRQRVLDVMVWLGDVRWASGDARGSWQALQRAVEVDPYAEQIYRRIMRLQSKLGRPDDAAATFRRLQARLVEVDLEPTPESTRLHTELTAP